MTAGASRSGVRIFKLSGYLRLRLLGRRVLATWLCLLRNRAERLGPWARDKAGDFLSRKAFMATNKRLQEELRQVFVPYHRFCPECGSACCREPEIPFSAIDRILYGMGQAGQTSPAGKTGAAKRDFLSCFRWSHLRRKLKNFSGAATQPAGQAAAAAFCPALTEAGCSLPWGERPSICVFCACPQILAEMEGPTYGRYVWVTLKYLTHLSLALGAARSAAAACGTDG